MNISFKTISVYLTLGFLLTLTAPVSAEQDPVKLLDQMVLRVEHVKDYTAEFQKQELVKGKLLPQENIFLKFRNPFSVYMKWLEGPHEGREVLYVRDKYKGKLIGHEGGFFGFVTLSLDPKGKRAMKGNRHPITEAGLSKLIARVLRDVKKADMEGVLRISPLKASEVFGRKSHRVTILLPNDPRRGFSASQINLWVDEEHGLPIKSEFFDWNRNKVESYGYKNLMLNVGLSEEDFSRDNKTYRF